MTRNRQIDLSVTCIILYQKSNWKYRQTQAQIWSTTWVNELLSTEVESEGSQEEICKNILENNCVVDEPIHEISECETIIAQDGSMYGQQKSKTKIYKPKPKSDHKITK